jgi:hypothetical protein
MNEASLASYDCSTIRKLPDVDGDNGSLAALLLLDERYQSSAGFD